MRRIFYLFLIVSFSPRLAQATVGFAEWAVYTPGGHVIRHQDGWKDEYGDCLTADDRNIEIPLSQRRSVYVRHLEYWQYYKDYVVGKSRKGFFVFNEVEKKVAFFKNEKSLKIEIGKRKLGEPLSVRLNGSDGWLENWFPLQVWPSCRRYYQKDISRNDALAQTMVEEKDCIKIRDGGEIRHYPLTTWGRNCNVIRAKAKTFPPERRELFESFCTFIAGMKEER